MATVQIYVQAIRLTNEIIAEKGDYLVIYPDDTVLTLSPEEAAKLGIRTAMRHANTAHGNGEKITSKSSRTSHAKRERDAKNEALRNVASIIPKEWRRVMCNINGKTIKMARSEFIVLEQMWDWKEPRHIGILNDYGRASTLKSKGFLTASKTDPGPLRRILTNNGRAIVQQVRADMARANGGAS